MSVWLDQWDRLTDQQERDTEPIMQGFVALADDNLGGDRAVHAVPSSMTAEDLERVRQVLGERIAAGSAEATLVAAELFLHPIPIRPPVALLDGVSGLQLREVTALYPMSHDQIRKLNASALATGRADGESVTRFWVLLFAAAIVVAVVVGIWAGQR